MIIKKRRSTEVNLGSQVNKLSAVLMLCDLIKGSVFTDEFRSDRALGVHLVMILEKQIVNGKNDEEI